ncbi:MAG: hypothetical protein NTV79_08385 [Candidatus Aureabacteria bacterium]|nr:hypothetical protein [Candidatus Auribacterota bacterium]
MTRFAVIAGLLLGAVSVALAQGQVDYPESLKGIVPPYPGAKIVMAFSNEEVDQAHLETTDAMEKVTAYYKSDLTGKGWKVASEMSVQNSRNYTLVKGEQSLAILVTGDQGVTTVTIALNK